MDTDGTLLQLPSAARTRWRITNAIAGLFGGLVLGLPPSLALAFGFEQPAGWVVAPVVVIAALALGQWFANRRFERFGYLLTDEVLRVRDGVVVHTDEVAPLFRVQHVDLGRGPIQLRFGLADLVVHTAAPAADITLPDLLVDDAERIRDQILASSRRAAEAMGVADVDAV